MSADQSPTPTKLPPPRRGSRRTILLGAVILVCGMLIGSGLTSHLLWGRLVHRARRPADMPGRIAQRMLERLDLTEEQRQQVEEILARHMTAMHQINQETRPRIDAEFERLRAEIAAVLTPEQVEHWEEHFESMRERWRPEHRGPPTPSAGGKRGRRHR